MSYHVFVKHGDARREVDDLVGELGRDAASAGLHKCIFAAQARQTVVMLAAADTPLAGALRGRAGWEEPEAGSRPH